MNSKKRKAKKAAEISVENAVKRRREEVQDQILTKARPFIAKTTVRPNEGAEIPKKESNPNPVKCPQKTPKRQKQPNVKKPKKNKRKGATPQVSPEERKSRAIAYLKAWRDKDDGWKFSKKIQIWLLRNLYNTKEILDDDFSVTLEYLDTITGPSRELMVTQAEGIFKDCEAKMDELGNETPESCKVNYERARQVLQML